MKSLKERISDKYGSALSLYSSPLLTPLENYNGWFLPQEEAVVKKACDKRKVDFLTGRYCARKAIDCLLSEEKKNDSNSLFIPVSPNRAPLWPKHIVGSITHTDGYCASVTGLKEKILSVGIDGQVMKPGRITEGMKKMILSECEMADGETMLNLIFSAKESLYKCLNPLVKRFFGFHTAKVTEINGHEQTFTIKIIDSNLKKEAEKHCCTSSFKGLYCISEQVVVTLIVFESI